MSAAIRVSSIWKEYQLGEAGTGAETLYELLSDSLRRVWRPRPSTSSRGADRQFWALRDVSFDVEQGEVLGVIGRNGAGKSTLLKILSRITEPTRGSAQIRGQVASLLEVGTGFHPELTGAENIFLNGAILGMKRRDIQARFDQIVAFAEVERFLHTPVKRYSSGMYVRLAFAVAAHLEPDVLIVDEVLAVGDAAFQRKCLEKIGQVGGEGRTVLFVSHNMTAVHQLCSRAVLLEGGAVAAVGPSAPVIERYLSSGLEEGEHSWPEGAGAPGNERVRLRGVRVLSRGVPSPVAMIDVPVEVEVTFQILVEELSELCVNIYLRDVRGVVVLSSANTDAASTHPTGWFRAPHGKGLYRARCVVPANFLNDIRYLVSVFLVTTSPIQVEAAAENVLSFSVHDTGALREPAMEGEWHGVVRTALDWQTDMLES